MNDSYNYNYYSNPRKDNNYNDDISLTENPEFHETPSKQNEFIFQKKRKSPNKNNYNNTSYSLQLSNNGIENEIKGENANNIEPDNDYKDKIQKKYNSHFKMLYLQKEKELNNLLEDYNDIVAKYNKLQGHYKTIYNDKFNNKNFDEVNEKNNKNDNGNNNRNNYKLTDIIDISPSKKLTKSKSEYNIINNNHQMEPVNDLLNDFLNNKDDYENKFDNNNFSSNLKVEQNKDNRIQLYFDARKFYENKLDISKENEINLKPEYKIFNKKNKIQNFYVENLRKENDIKNLKIFKNDKFQIKKEDDNDIKNKQKNNNENLIISEENNFNFISNDYNQKNNKLFNINDLSIIQRNNLIYFPEPKENDFNNNNINSNINNKCFDINDLVIIKRNDIIYYPEQKENNLNNNTNDISSDINNKNNFKKKIKRKTREFGVDPIKELNQIEINKESELEILPIFDKKNKLDKINNSGKYFSKNDINEKLKENNKQYTIHKLDSYYIPNMNKKPFFYEKINIDNINFKENNENKYINIEPKRYSHIIDEINSSGKAEVRSRERLLFLCCRIFLDM